MDWSNLEGFFGYVQSLWEDPLRIGGFNRVGIAGFGIVQVIVEAKKKLKDLRANAGSTGGLSLSEILHSRREAKDRDPRDRIYSLLSLCEERDRKSIQPNYTSNLKDVLTLVARYCISIYGPRALSLVGEQRVDLPLPSWVPS